MVNALITAAAVGRAAADDFDVASSTAELFQFLTGGKDAIQGFCVDLCDLLGIFLPGPFQHL